MGKRRGPWNFEVIAVPAETYPDLQINPRNSYSELSDDDRYESCVQALAEALVEGQRIKSQGK